ncbi:MAG: PAS domain S-box protein [Myxococcota bacterium]
MYDDGAEETLAVLARVMELDEQALERRKRWLALTDEDAALLKALRPLMRDRAADLFDDFYAHMLHFDETRGLLLDPPERLGRLKGAQRRYFERLIQGEYDWEYALDRLRVGLVHERVGLQPAWYLGAYARYVGSWLPAIIEWFDGDTERAVATMQALLKVASLDIGLALDTYMEADRQRLVELTDFNQRLLASMASGLVVTREDLTVCHANRAFHESFATPSAPVEDRHVAELIDAPELEPLLGHVLATGEAALARDLRARGPDGTSRPLRLTVTRVGSGSPRRPGEPRLLVLVDDLTEEERLREEARASELRFREVVEHATDAIVLADGSGTVTYFNAAAEDLFGYRRDEMLGVSASRLVPRGLREAHERGIRRYSKGPARPRRITRQLEGLRKDGSRVPVECTVSAIHHDGDTVVTAILRDVTERRRAEEALRARARQQEIVAALGQRALTGDPPEALFQAAVDRVSSVYDGTPCLLHAVRDDGGAPALRATAGVDAGTADAAVAREDGQAAFTLQSAGPVLVQDLATERRFSSPRSLLEAGVTGSLAVPVRGVSGSWGVLCAYARDGRRFTEDDVHFLQSVANVLGSAVARRTTQRELRRSERSFRTLIEQLPDAIAVIRGERFVYVNEALVRQMGFDDASALVGEHLGRVIDSECWPTVRERLAAMERTGGAAPLTEERVRHRDGSVMPIEVAAIPADFDGKPAIVAVARDLTERHELMARMMQMDRMVTVGTLAAGVGHEINNPLAYVSANVDVALEHLQPVQRAVERMAGVIADELGEERLEGILREAGEERLREDLVDTVLALGEARDGSRRIRDVVRDLKSFSRGEETYGPVPVEAFLRSAINMAWNEVRHRARLVEDLQPVPMVHGNEGRLAQVFLNLLVNASQALPEGAAGEHEVRIRTRAEGPAVLIEVEDTGSGIPDDVRDRIFDPFFTTKPVGQGTGLGLAIGHRIIDRHGGSIDVDSHPGRTTFRVTLPASNEGQEEAEPSRLAPTPPPTSPSDRRPRVLVVDDEAPVGRMLRRMLRRDWEVLAVTSSREALPLLRDGRWDAVVCDLMLPDMTGMDLYEAVDEDVRRRFVFLTGGAFTPRARTFLEEVSAPTLDKPVDARVLRDTLRDLAEPGAGEP